MSDGWVDDLKGTLGLSPSQLIGELRNFSGIYHFVIKIENGKFYTSEMSKHEPFIESLMYESLMSGYFNTHTIDEGYINGSNVKYLKAEKHNLVKFLYCWKSENYDVYLNGSRL